MMLKRIIHTKISGVPVHAWLLLLVICLVGYWPVSSNLFSLKNDAYIYFLPCRVFISQCIRQGHLPLWDPYFYMGFPMHGDMQAGCWNPVVWLFSLFTSYNMTALQYETLLYVFIAGIGMYKLLEICRVSAYTKLSLAACYMFCGFVVNTGQITVWTGSAAFLPFVLLYYYRLLTQQQGYYVNALKTAVALYFLLTAGYPSFLFMTAYIMLFAFISHFIAAYKKRELSKKGITNLLMANVVVVIAFLLIALPALFSYIDYFPYYQRSSGTSLAEAQTNPFNPFAIISYLLPLSVSKDHVLLTTDPTARNAYIGIFTMLMLVAFFRKKINGLSLFILCASIFTFLFSLGDALPVRAFGYHYLPAMNLFRHPANMRLFTSIGILLMTAYGLERFFTAVKEKEVKLYYIYTIAAAVLIIIMMGYYAGSSSLVQKISGAGNSAGQALDTRALLKSFYHGFSFSDAIILEGIIQIVFLLVFALLIQRRKVSGIVFLIIFNSLFIAQFTIPATFVTQVSPNRINTLIKESPFNFPIPIIEKSIAAYTAKEDSTERKFGCAAFYKKEIVQVSEELNPSFTNSLKEFDACLPVSKTVLQYPLCYFADTIVLYKDSLQQFFTNKKILFANSMEKIPNLQSGGGDSSKIHITQFAPWGITIETDLTTQKPFVLFQNYNSNWKLTIDGKPVPVKKGNISFMYATVEKGHHLMEWKYKPGYLLYAMFTSIIAFIVSGFILIKYRKIKPSSLS